MLRTDWNELRSGDRVLVHHTTDGRARLVAGTVVAAVAGGGSNDVSVRLGELSGSPVIHPSRLVVHHDPVEFDGHCWRCAADQPPSKPAARHA